MRRFSLLFPRWLVGVLLGYVILAVIYSVSTPIFEPPDEVFHFSMIDHIADHGSLPVQQVGQNALWHQEGSQPPLYYGVSALLVKFIDRSDLLTRQARNPHVKIGIGLAQHNYTLVKHDWDAEAISLVRDNVGGACAAVLQYCTRIRHSDRDLPYRAPDRAGRACDPYDGGAHCGV